MEGFKQCPDCQCTDVPINAEICPFCGHSFGKLQKAGSAGGQNQLKKKPVMVQNQAKTKPVAVQNQPESVLTVVQNRSEAKQAVKREEPVAPVQDKGRGRENKISAAPSSAEYKASKKKHGFLKFLIAAAVLAFPFVWFRFLKPSGEDVDNQSGGTADIYSEPLKSTDFESMETDSQMADEEEEWTDESGKSLEMDSEEVLVEEAGDNLQFILLLSDQAFLTREDIEGLSAEELRIARNEIYARHGRIFKDEGLQAYFNGCDWYEGTVLPDDFTDSVFNEYERANKDLIVSYEHELGVNGQ